LAIDGINLVLKGFSDATKIEPLQPGLAAQYGVKVLADGTAMSKPRQIEVMMKKAERSRRYGYSG